MNLRTFDDVVRYMESFTNLERQVDHYTTRTYRLDRMRAILDHFGHPEAEYRKLHVAGSKGKGSTASYLAAGLTALGCPTGLYLSPHLVDYRERFLFNGRFADEKALLESGRELEAGISSLRLESSWGEDHATTFELYTTFAFLLFRNLHASWAVLETGLGGRLDATNTIVPEASILCPIEKEHTRILGDTIEKIAVEKSKIIKKGKPVFVGLERDEAFSVFKAEAEAQKSPLYSLRAEIRAMEGEITEEGEKVRYLWKDGREERLNLSMKGEVQAQNCALALLTLRTLGLCDEERTVKAMEENRLPGRFEKIAERPEIYIDGAHTPNSIRSLLNSYTALRADRSRTCAIYGALLDKDHRHMSRLMLDSFDHIIISRPGSYKPSDIGAIYAMMKREAPEKDIRLLSDNGEALKEAKSIVGEDGSILICGSFYLAGAFVPLVSR